MKCFVKLKEYSEDDLGRYYLISQSMKTTSQGDSQDGWIECGPDVKVSEHFFDSEEMVFQRFPDKPHEEAVFDFGAMVWNVADSSIWEDVKQRRYFLLQSTDWMVARSMELGVDMPAEWVAYRQALRDITLQPDPRSIIWPEAPTEASAQA